MNEQTEGRAPEEQAAQPRAEAEGDPGWGAARFRALMAPERLKSLRGTVWAIVAIVGTMVVLWWRVTGGPGGDAPGGAGDFSALEEARPGDPGAVSEPARAAAEQAREGNGGDISQWIADPVEVVEPEPAPSSGEDERGGNRLVLSNPGEGDDEAAADPVEEVVGGSTAMPVPEEAPPLVLADPDETDGFGSAGAPPELPNIAPFAQSSNSQQQTVYQPYTAFRGGEGFEPQPAPQAVAGPTETATDAEEQDDGPLRAEEWLARLRFPWDSRMQGPAVVEVVSGPASGESFLMTAQVTDNGVAGRGQVGGCQVIGMERDFSSPLFGPKSTRAGRIARGTVRHLAAGLEAVADAYSQWVRLRSQPVTPVVSLPTIAPTEPGGEPGIGLSGGGVNLNVRQDAPRPDLGAVAVAGVVSSAADSVQAEDVLPPVVLESGYVLGLAALCQDGRRR